MNEQGVTFILIDSQQRILMQQRDDGQGKIIKYPNQWCFPGGSKEPDESFDECVVREVGEEYGIRLSPQQCQYVLSYTHDDGIEDFVYVCYLDKSTVTDIVMREGKDMKWLTLKEIEKVDLAWGQNSLIPTLEKNISNHQ